MHWDLRLEHEGTLASWAVPKGIPVDPKTQRARRPDRGPPARVPRLPRRDPRRQLRRGDDEDLRPRHLRAAQVARQGGDGHLPRRARARQVRPVPHRRQELDDPPHGSAGGSGLASRCRSGSSRCSPSPASCRGDEGWAYEIKWDGVRAVAYIEGGRIRLTSRRKTNITPRLSGAARARAARSARTRRCSTARSSPSRRPAELPAPAAADEPDLARRRCAGSRAPSRSST